MSARIAVVVAGLLALALPLPIGGMLVVSVVGLVALAYSFWRPGSNGPAFVVIVAVLEWLGTPSSDVHVARLVALALALCIVHACSALAAVVPPRADVPGQLVVRWVAWAAGATAVGVGVLGAASLLPSGRMSVSVTTVAVVAAGCGGVVLVALARGGRTS
jgi:hypothetical protein